MRRGRRSGSCATGSSPSRTNSPLTPWRPPKRISHCSIWPAPRSICSRRWPISRAAPTPHRRRLCERPWSRWPPSSGPWPARRAKSPWEPLPPSPGGWVFPRSCVWGSTGCFATDIPGAGCRVPAKPPRRSTSPRRPSSSCVARRSSTCCYPGRGRRHGSRGSGISALRPEKAGDGAGRVPAAQQGVHDQGGGIDDFREAEVLARYHAMIFRLDKEGKDRVEPSSGVGHDDRLRMQAELLPGKDLEKFVQRPEAARQDREGVGPPAHLDLALVHRSRDDPFREALVGEFLRAKELRDDADHFPPLFENPVREDSHEANGAASVDQRDLFVDQPVGECDRVAPEKFGNQIARAAENAQRLNFHPEKILPIRGNGKRGR